MKILMRYVFALMCAIPSSSLFADSVQIKFSEASIRDPLLLYRFPESPSRDLMVFKAGGLLIKQPSSSDQREPDSVGVRVTSSLRGDFLFEIDLECVKLSPPRSGWGHGLMVKFVFADETSPAVSIGCIATPKFEKAYRIATERAGEKPFFKTEPSDFTSGKWILQREGNRFVFSVDGVDGVREVYEFEHTAAELLEIQIWANRLPKDNGHSEFLLRQLEISGDQFFARSEITRSRLGVWTPLFIALATAILLTSVYVFNRSR